MYVCKVVILVTGGWTLIEYWLSQEIMSATKRSKPQWRSWLLIMCQIPGELQSCWCKDVALISARCDSAYGWTEAKLTHRAGKVLEKWAMSCCSLPTFQKLDWIPGILVDWVPGICFAGRAPASTMSHQAGITESNHCSMPQAVEMCVRRYCLYECYAYKYTVWRTELLGMW
jgi:hypothetical protein